METSSCRYLVCQTASLPFQIPVAKNEISRRVNFIIFYLKSRVPNAIR